jgi:hypothetical protein
MTNLPDLLKQIDHEAIVPDADRSVEAALMQAFDSAVERRRSRISNNGWMALAATVVCVTLAGASLFQHTDRGPELSAAPAPNPFQLWPGAELLPRFESGQLVRMDLGTVIADVLVAQDGLPRAYRVVSRTQGERRR